jgi:serine/threonine protein kinase
VTQLIDAVAYLHAQHIVHRDVKLANCLVFTSPHDALPVLKLTDFGLSMALNDDDHKLQIFCGTPSYMAPEIVQRTPYLGQPADMWR